MTSDALCTKVERISFGCAAQAKEEFQATVREAKVLAVIAKHDSAAAAEIERYFAYKIGYALQEAVHAPEDAQELSDFLGEIQDEVDERTIEKLVALKPEWEPIINDATPGTVSKAFMQKCARHFRKAEIEAAKLDVTDVVENVLGLHHTFKSEQHGWVYCSYSCDRSGREPIMGTRYNLRGDEDYDLCQAEYDQLGGEERDLYEAIPPPATMPAAWLTLKLTPYAAVLSALEGFLADEAASTVVGALASSARIDACDAPTESMPPSASPAYKGTAAAIQPSGPSKDVESKDAEAHARNYSTEVMVGRTTAVGLDSGESMKAAQDLNTAKGALYGMLEAEVKHQAQARGVGEATTGALQTLEQMKRGLLSSGCLQLKAEDVDKNVAAQEKPSSAVERGEARGLQLFGNYKDSVANVANDEEVAVKLAVVEELANAIADTCSLTKLHFTDELSFGRHSTAADEGVEMIAQALLRRGRNGGGGESGGEEGSERGGGEDSVQGVGFVVCTYRSDGAPTGVELALDEHATSLDLGTHSLPSPLLRLIAAALMSNTTLVALSLRGGARHGHFTPVLKSHASVLSLERLLRFNHTLTQLDLSANAIGELGGTVLARGLRENATLRVLSLSNNFLNGAAAQALGGALSGGRCGLRSLDLRFNSLHEDGGVHLGHALASPACARLTHLDVSDNALRARGAAGIARALRVNDSLTSLNLSYNTVGSAGAVALLEAVLHCSDALTALDLRMNALRATERRTLADAATQERPNLQLLVQPIALPVEGVPRHSTSPPRWSASPPRQSTSPPRSSPQPREAGSLAQKQQQWQTASSEARPLPAEDDPQEVDATRQALWDAFESRHLSSHFKL